MTFLRRGCLLVVLLLLGLSSTIGTAQSGSAQTPTGGTPVLGPALLNAAQLADWYRSTGIVSRSPTDIDTLARMFIDEGAAQGVRGDIAFAQSMLETGHLRYGGQVLPSDHNFSGLGACDSCRRGLAFPDPLTGVRAQIQHLWAYASPAARADATARPNVDVRFHLVQPPGRSPLWEQMGGGNWATDPDYAGKVLTIYGAMLRRAGLAADAARVVTAPPDRPVVRVVRASPNGAVHIGAWAPHRTGADGASALLGPSTQTTTRPAGCLSRWANHGVILLTRGRCDLAGATIGWVRLTAGWRTARGLAVGDSRATLRRLYPRAKRVGATYRLVVGRSGSRPVVRLSAEVRNGRVRAFIANARPLAN